MNHWVVGILVWCLAGLIAVVIVSVWMYVHYARMYGPELTLTAINEVMDNWESSWAFIPFNMILWPYRLPAIAIPLNRDLKEWFEANVQAKES